MRTDISYLCRRPASPIISCLRVWRSFPFFLGSSRTLLSFPESRALHSLSFIPGSYVRVLQGFLKCGLWTSSTGTTCQLVRSADSWLPLHICYIRKPEGRAPQSVFNTPCPSDANACSSVTPTGIVVMSMESDCLSQNLTLLLCGLHQVSVSQFSHLKTGNNTVTAWASQESCEEEN